MCALTQQRHWILVTMENHERLWHWRVLQPNPFYERPSWESMGVKTQRRKLTGNRARELLSFPIAALTHMEDPDG